MVGVDDSQGFQAGDHNFQVNFFYAGQPREQLAPDSRPLRVFVAMPGSSMGEKAKWDDIEEIKQRLLRPAAAQLGQELGCPVELVIEKDKLAAGSIHTSMFREAVDSDVYIADLSGANANVYLELGVRWALKDNITILISQDIHDDVKFNVSGNRVIPYGPMPNELDRAVSQIVASAVSGMRNPSKIDSPVRNSLPLVTAPRSDWDALHEEIARLKETQADDLLAAARRAAPAQAIALLQQAVDSNPLSIPAHLQLGVALRKAADYQQAIAELRKVIELDEDSAEGWRELGVALSTSGQLADAAEAFRRAVQLDDADGETWATLGGLRRRLARSSAGPAFNWDMLRESRDAYHRASQLFGNDTYPLVNEARVNLLLSAVQPDIRPAVMNRLRTLENLARFQAYPDPPARRDPWKGFDLTDTLLLTGRVEAGLAELRSAIELIDPQDRESSLSSVIAPHQDYLALDVLDEPAAAGVRQAIGICEQAASAARTGTAG
jgi:tetratricopeptide (TPR) repeat protein